MIGSLNLSVRPGYRTLPARMKKVHHGARAEGRTTCGRGADAPDADDETRPRGGYPGTRTGRAPPRRPYSSFPAGKDEKSPALIRFESVTKRYPGGTVAVDDLSLEVPAGQTMVLVGPSGCGKTTSLRMINRLVEPTSGRILLDGNDVMRANPAILRRGIGDVIQQAGLFPHRTVEDNIATVPLLTGWPKARARRRARELMDLVGLDAQMARRYPTQLSGGQQQRVGVARALAADPPVLLMDEPFSAVDPIVRASLQDELLRLQAELNKTIVFVTHDIEEAIKVGDLVAIFRP